MRYGLLLLALATAPTIVTAQAARHTAARSTARVAPHPAPPPKPKPSFSFLGDDTETVSQRRSLNNAACRQEEGVWSCTDYSHPQVAGARLDFMWMKYNGGKLYSVFSSMQQHAYPTILAAFAEKYGPPSREEKRKWQSKGGAIFDNNVDIWEFKGGELELDSMGLDTETASFSFESRENAPAAAKPKIDF